MLLEVSGATRSTIARVLPSGDQSGPAVPRITLPRWRSTRDHQDFIVAMLIFGAPDEGDVATVR